MLGVVAYDKGQTDFLVSNNWHGYEVSDVRRWVIQSVLVLVLVEPHLVYRTGCRETREKKVGVSRD